MTDHSDQLNVVKDGSFHVSVLDSGWVTSFMKKIRNKEGEIRVQGEDSFFLQHIAFEILWNIQ